MQLTDETMRRAESGTAMPRTIRLFKWLPVDDSRPIRVRVSDFASLMAFRATVISARRSASQPTLGIVKWRWPLVNDNGADVLDLVASSFFQIGQCSPNWPVE